MNAPRILNTPAAEAYSCPLLIRHLLANVAGQSSAEIVSGDLRLTYPVFTQRVARLASLLAGKGVRPGDTVAVMDWDSHRYLECYFAIPMMGAVLQTVNVRLSPAQIAFTLEQSGASLLLYNADFAPVCAELLRGQPTIREAIVMAGTTCDDYEVLLADSSPDFAFADFDENAVATTFHTTGTTGDPKQVFFTHRQLVLHTLALSAALANQPDGQGMRRSDVYMPMTPMFHVHAWGMPYVATMLGSKQVYPGRYDPARLLALKRREGVTLSHCVPTILRMLLDANGAESSSLAPWTVVIGGAALPEALAREARRAGITTVVGYGMSETGPVISLARGEDGEDTGALCRAGFPIPFVQARIEDGNGGELVLRAPWLTQGHATQAASDALWAGGWLHTGDVAARDPDGALRIVDRLKDVIKSGGEWVSTVELENLLEAEGSIAEAAVIGVPDAKWGERPVAFVVAAGGFDPGAVCDVFQGHVASGRLSRYAVPERVIAVDSLPRTSVGKIDKKALRALLDERAR
ncbi:fatty-acyl-CoA synthase [Novosphingobium sp. ST904]|nr:fatty-acyl-CoA synthase [Novosphingobium sp. ST904]